MRKKYRTLEEWRAAERERQKRWREEHRGYERLRAKNARGANGARKLGGTGSGIGNSESGDNGSGARDEGAAISQFEEVPDVGGFSAGGSDERIVGDEEAAGRVGGKGTPDGELIYSDEDPDDCRTGAQKARHEGRFAKMKRAVQKASQEPEPDQAAIRQVQAWAEGRRAARKPGVAVPELEL